MKLRFLLLLGGCITLFAQYGCSTKVEVIGMWKDIPVVYGVINHQDSINYVRIERAYLPPNQSALEVAQNPDSLYFDTADVKVTMSYINQVGDTILWPTAFERVRLADEGITRDKGIFANDPAYVYKLIGRTAFDLLLKIEHRKTGKVFYARTESVRVTSSTGYKTNLILNPAYASIPIAWRRINQEGEEVYGSVSVDMTSDGDQIGFASIYDYIFRFHYKEYEVDGNNNPIAGSEVDKYIDWRAAWNFIPTSTAKTKRVIKGEAFYYFLENNLSNVTGTNIRRCIGFLEVYIDGASEPLKKYLEAKRANYGVIGGLYPADPYSNVSDGYGVFATSDRLERPDLTYDPRLMEMSSLSREYLRDRTLNYKNIGFVSAQPCY